LKSNLSECEAKPDICSQKIPAAACAPVGASVDVGQSLAKADVIAPTNASIPALNTVNLSSSLLEFAMSETVGSLLTFSLRSYISTIFLNMFGAKHRAAKDNFKVVSSCFTSTSRFRHVGMFA
jgi:hypothetical protein